MAGFVIGPNEGSKVSGNGSTGCRRDGAAASEPCATRSAGLTPPDPAPVPSCGKLVGKVEGRGSDPVSGSTSGDRMSIRSPAKVNVFSRSKPRVLASGVDSLNLAVNLRWRDAGFLKRFEQERKQAEANGVSVVGSVKGSVEVDDFRYEILEHGSHGYRFLLRNSEYSLKIGNWMEPQQRPSVMVEIRSFTNWSVGPVAAVERILRVFDSLKAEIESVKVSRVDLCVDILVAEKFWRPSLFSRRVTRASKFVTFEDQACVTGVQIGKGAISARIYDKFLEIRTKSRKFWMLKVWSVSEIAEDARVIRVEFQIRREKLKELGIDTQDDLWALQPNLWAYCTDSWLKFQTRPGKHHTQRKTLPWWRIVQNSYQRAQGAEPLVPAAAVRVDEDRAIGQMFGHLISAAASGWVGHKLRYGDLASWEDLLDYVREALESRKLKPKELTVLIQSKLVKRHWDRLKHASQQARRDQLRNGSERRDEE